ncbi:tRNA uridine-5-carboxymethylaminomethyl(34) synthesis GTPase MnmE, partial [Bacteroidota bacterium]
MPIMNEDTITAIATPAGVGAVSIIRVSGSKSFDAVDKIFIGKVKVSEAKTHTIHYGKIVNDKDEVIDDVLISVFKNPKSYTGEDSVEISTHGGSLVTQKVIGLLMEHDVRLADPGEFTKRAFLNGKLDLAQAEAVADIIASRTEASLRGARNQLDGILSAKVDSLREMLIHASSLIELELDFAEEDLEFMPLDKIQQNINTIVEEIDNLLKTYSFGKVLRDGVNVALVGKPNVGKSSLLNYLLKESRAIVSEIPGTTRDVIREEVSIEGILFRLYDTAGIRLTDDTVEKEGVHRSRQAVEEADLVLFINDIDSGFAIDLYNQLLELTSEERIVKVLNKIDLPHEGHFKADVDVSALTGEGMEILLEEMRKRGAGSESYTEKTAIVSNIRHFNALKKAKEGLLTAGDSISNKLSGEFISVDLRNAESFLGEIIG